MGKRRHPLVLEEGLTVPVARRDLRVAARGESLLLCAHQVLSALMWPGFEILLRRRSPQRCFSAQVGQRVWPEMAGWRQFTHRLFAKASARILAERANS